MKRCPTCNHLFPSQLVFCPHDGRELETQFVLDDKYQLNELIGEGGMGQVYRATHLHIGTQFAIKVLKPDLVADPTSVERFRREARAAAQIAHPNAVLVTDFGVDRSSGIVYLVMELLEGMSLRKRLTQSNQMLPEEIMLILAQVCSALQMAHSKGIIHRDIKPDNIFLTSVINTPFTVKVLDFGLAKLKKSIEDDASSLTNAGTILGTPCYMSPEQCLAEPLDTRSDIYSLGIVIYQLFVGTVPFPGPGMSKILMQHCQTPPQRPRKIVPDLPVGVERAILQALEKKPTHRQQTMMDLFYQLETGFTSAGIKIHIPSDLIWKTSASEANLAGASNQPHLNQTNNQDSSDLLELQSTLQPTELPDNQSTLPHLAHPEVQTKAPVLPLTQSTAIDQNLLTHSAGFWVKPGILVLSALFLLSTAITGYIIFYLNSPKPETKPNNSALTAPPPGMVLVPGGELVMGNNTSSDLAEKPEHRVQVQTFFLDMLEVTNQDYSKFLQATQYQPPPHWKTGDYPAGENNYPVTNITWNDAQAYARWAGKRLPTEIEWEYAARGSNRRVYPWGNDFNSAFANTKESQKTGPMPVGSYPKGASFCNALDLVGNVAEWTDSTYQPYPGSKAKPVADRKIIRGGDFRRDKLVATTTTRLLATPATRDLALGFRCAQDIPN